MTINDDLSVTNSEWKIKNTDFATIEFIKQRYKLSDLTARVLASRIEIIDKQSCDNYLNPYIKHLLPDPYHLKDMDLAIKRIIKAINDKEKIIIYGDYDVDGATSSALMKNYFSAINIKSDIYIPDRIKEGYGPNSKALTKLKQEENFSLCLMLDCGTVAFEPLEVAHSINLDVIVVDHHISKEELPKAVAVINPNRIDQESVMSDSCAVAVSFLLLVALQRALINNSYFTNNNLKEVDLMSFLDLVALGTVCDVMKLTGLNRAFVKQGLKIMTKRKNLGLTTLCDKLDIKEAPSVYHLGYVIGPHINAGGRIGESYSGAHLLSTKNEAEADDIAIKLQDYNKLRKEIEQDAVKSALKMIDTDQYVVVAHEDWHPGIIGIVAGRIKEVMNLPAIVISIDEKTNIGKASARSVNNFNIGSFILEAKDNGILIEGGGHAMAGGFSIDMKKIIELKNFLYKSIQHHKFTKILYADAITTIEGINRSLWDDLQKLTPYGHGNQEPRIIIMNIKLLNMKLIAGSHMICDICCIYSNKKIKGINFKTINNKLLLDGFNQGNATNVFGKIMLNDWNKSLEFMIEDIK
ncbi:MAG: single-stranded-DNA-specific exonuclease RecJ [Anaplasmataceae bacterium]|nr:single-stranded-DNA-specific exonuclease RecJ [Anaplasmataceae bacterium]